MENGNQFPIYTRFSIKHTVPGIVPGIASPELLDRS